MNVVRCFLGFVAIVGLLLTQPSSILNASSSSDSDPDQLYTVRIERGKNNRVQFKLIEPRGDSVVEAEQLDLILTKKGLLIKPGSTALAAGTAGHLLFDNFRLFLPTDGSEPFMEGDVPR
jgi:hypothetical protein